MNSKFFSEIKSKTDYIINSKNEEKKEDSNTIFKQETLNFNRTVY